MTPHLHKLETRMARLREACQERSLPYQGAEGVRNMYALNERLSGSGKEEARALLNKSFEYIRASQT